MVFDTLLLFVLVFWVLNVCVSLAFLGKLAYVRLVDVYPWLCLFVVIYIAETVLRIAFPARAGTIFLYSEGLRTAVSILVLWEMVRLGFEGYAALAVFIRKASWYMIAGCLLFSLLSWTLNPELPPGRSALFHATSAAIHSVTAGLVGYLLLVIAFMGWFPVRMRRNVAFLMIGFVAFFIGRWVESMGNNLSPDKPNWANLFGVCVAAACVVSWTLLLNREGEQIQTVTGHRWNPSEMARLSRQLDKINAGLVRMSG